MLFAQIALPQFMSPLADGGLVEYAPYCARFLATNRLRTGHFVGFIGFLV